MDINRGHIPLKMKAVPFIREIKLINDKDTRNMERGENLRRDR